MDPKRPRNDDDDDSITTRTKKNMLAAAEGTGDPLVDRIKSNMLAAAVAAEKADAQDKLETAARVAALPLLPHVSEGLVDIMSYVEKWMGSQVTLFPEFAVPMISLRNGFLPISGLQSQWWDSLVEWTEQMKTLSSPTESTRFLTEVRTAKNNAIQKVGDAIINEWKRRHPLLPCTWVSKYLGDVHVRYFRVETTTLRVERPNNTPRLLWVPK